MHDWWDASDDQVLACPRHALVEVGGVLPSAGRIVVARLDGARMMDVDHALYEFSAALLFSGYFGWNWDALSDCLRDLNWLPADGYLIVLENVPLLLSDETEERHTLFRILSRAARAWANPLGRPGGRGVPFRVLLLCDGDQEAAVLRLELADATRKDR
ncbi:barstar family protein [Micromonospora sp. RTGN7]|uniref:barstar family protein n=1 Tax=Micromonospora sp. RTGN7 TaxID=3016526 RepID=UPI0029FF54F6|nr:barstar family protein [Micromonospora sp. RTGN7]